MSVILVSEYADIRQKEEYRQGTAWIIECFYKASVYVAQDLNNYEPVRLGIRSYDFISR